MNACCHYCRLAESRSRDTVEYVGCSLCRKRYCSSCLDSEDRLGIDLFVTKIPGWICPCCRDECCCSYYQCAMSHVHCATFNRTERRHQINPPKYIKKKKECRSPQTLKRKFPDETFFPDKQRKVLVALVVPIIIDF